MRFSWFRAALVASIAVGVSAALAADSKFNRKLNVGSKAPSWKGLPGVDNKSHALADHKDARAVVVFFTSNHCPTSAQYESRVRRLIADFRDRKLAVIAINPGTEASETLEKMTRRARDRKYDFAYVRDHEQQTAKEYGAVCTPHYFLLGPADDDGTRRIAYMGAFDDSMDVDRVENHYLRDAVEAVLSGKTVEVPESRPFGCPIDFE
ncbi:MAG: thioredoxin family protein [Planctomycetaceae bacterium]|nr:thioredoxin family protein [Planctomycetaceae bacterium]